MRLSSFASARPNREKGRQLPTARRSVVVKAVSLATIIRNGAMQWAISDAMMKTLSGFTIEWPGTKARIAIHEPESGNTHPSQKRYVAVRQGRFVEKIATRPIKQACDAAVRHSGTTN